MEEDGKELSLGMLGYEVDSTGQVVSY